MGPSAPRLCVAHADLARIDRNAGGIIGMSLRPATGAGNPAVPGSALPQSGRGTGRGRHSRRRRSDYLLAIVCAGLLVVMTAATMPRAALPIGTRCPWVG